MAVQFKFAPTFIGPARIEYEIVFLDQTIPSIRVAATGECSDLPVQLEHTVMNMLTCQFGRTYHDHMVIRNGNPTSAASIKFELPKGCAQYFDIAPKTAFIPATVS